MRYVLIVWDPGATVPPDREGGLAAALESARTPALDAMGTLGKVGLAATRIAGERSFGRGALALLGVPEAHAAGVSDGVLDALAASVELRPGDAVLRTNLVRVSPDDAEGLMLAAGDSDNTADPDRAPTPAGGPREADALFADLATHWRDEDLLGPDTEIVDAPVRTDRPAPADRDRLLIVRPPADAPAPFAGVEMVEPTAVLGEPWVEHLPDGGRGDDARRLCELISASRHFLAAHPINENRRDQGLDPINLAWIWDAGTMPDLAEANPLAEGGPLFGARVIIDGGSPRAAGLCALLGIDATRAHDDALVDAASTGDHTVSIVFTDRGIAEADSEIVAPLLERLSGQPIGGAGEPIGEAGDLDDAGWRVLFAASHDPALNEIGPDRMSPFVLAGGRVRSVVARRLCDAAETDLIVDPASDLLEYVLRSGLRGLV